MRCERGLKVDGMMGGKKSCEHGSIAPSGIEASSCNNDLEKPLAVKRGPFSKTIRHEIQMAKLSASPRAHQRIC